jgi:hypothetical protein
MGIGVSTLLMAAGAVLTFAVEVDSTEGFNINTLGIILMIAGVIGLLMTLVVFGPRRRDVVDDGGTVVETRRRRDYY